MHTWLASPVTGLTGGRLHRKVNQSSISASLWVSR